MEKTIKIITKRGQSNFLLAMGIRRLSAPGTKDRWSDEVIGTQKRFGIQE